MSVVYPPELDAYITTEVLAGNAIVKKHGVIVGLDNNILSTKDILIYPHKIVLEFSSKYAPYAHQVFAKYKTTTDRTSWNSTFFGIIESGENMYNILTNIHNILKEIEEKYNRANRDVEQCLRN